jgi:hypothetical protein
MIERGFEIRKGMDVRDSEGEKIGSIKQLFRPDKDRYELAEMIMHVETGILGLGSDLYIPGGAVKNVDDDGVYLNVTNDHITAARHWNERPAGLPES